MRVKKKNLYETENACGKRSVCIDDGGGVVKIRATTKFYQVSVGMRARAARRWPAAARDGGTTTVDTSAAAAAADFSLFGTVLLSRCLVL